MVNSVFPAIENSNFLYHNGGTMKHIIIAILLCSVGMAVFGQSADMSYYTEEYNRPGATFRDRLEVLENVRDDKLTGIGAFYHSALKVLLQKYPDIRTREDRELTEASAEIICRGLAAEKHGPAAADLWQLVQYFDILKDINNNSGLIMREALIAMGQTGDTNFVPQIGVCLMDLNTRSIGDPETRRKIQRGVTGTVNALEALHDIAGYRPVFFAYVRGYDKDIQAMAYDALPNIVEDPGEVIIQIIRDTSNNPLIKLRAWEEMLRTRAPDSSKAKVAAAALDTGWTYSTSDRIFQENLKTMRKGALDIIRDLGAEDASVYTNLKRSYDRNFISTAPDYVEIKKTLDALSALKTDDAVNLLLGFLEELHSRRRSGTWGNRERYVMQLLIPNIAATKTQNPRVRTVLTTIQRSQDYTGAEQGWARDALKELGY